MRESLDEAKTRLAQKYMGKAGVHGIGLRRAEEAICVYFEPVDGEEQDTTLRQIRSDAAPYTVVVVPAERAAIT